ncbi:hypothetical protein ACIQ1H_16985 [Lysinibacillus sp. NPDC097279]|uniref:hypothetical protein n=1 Tax=Lysinibacillus sp. NPDC097279 TaxID=3364143 RepID=UPI0038118930
MKRKKLKVELGEANVSEMNQDSVIRCEETVYTIQRRLSDLNWFAENGILVNPQIVQIIGSINSSLKELRINLSDIKEYSKIKNV